jgi:hypothetical protein
MKYLRAAMRQSKHRKTPSLHLHNGSSRETSPDCSSGLSDCEADDEGFMSSGELVPSRPSSLTFSGSHLCSRQPTLQEVLNGTAPSPWTLSALTAYLSQNHCLETLEFTLDAKRYTTHYQGLAERHPLTPISPTSPDSDYMRMLWQKLMDAYIAPNGPREVNLPSDVRDRLLSLPCKETPPNAAELEPAVKIIYELMDESVLVPFIYSLAPVPMTDSFVGMAASIVSSLDEHKPSLFASRTYNQKDPATTPSNDASLPNGKNQPNTSRLSATSRISTFFSGSSASSSADHPDSMTDDSTDYPSSAGSALEPITPPSTPPISNADLSTFSETPHTSRHEGSSWKKMGAMLGWKKTSRPGTSSSTSSYRHPGDVYDDGSGSGQ